MARRREARERRLHAEVANLRASWTIEERRIVRAMRYAYKEPGRLALRLERDRRRRQLDESVKWVARERERETGLWLSQLAPNDRELARGLLVDQEKDERRLQIQYEQSLDKPDDDGTMRPAPLGGVHFDREDDQWPYIAERSRRVNIRRIARRRFNAQEADYLGVSQEFARRRSPAKSGPREGTDSESVVSEDEMNPLLVVLWFVVVIACMWYRALP